MVRFGVALPTQIVDQDGSRRGKALREYAQRVEALGFDSIWVTEHLLKGTGRYAVSRLEPLTTLSFIANCTQRVRLGTSIIILPYRHPVILAKEVATLADLCEGRFILGVGTGWDHHEFAACGVNPRERGSRTDESLAILRLLFSQPNASFSGRYYRFEDVTIEPRLPQPPPIWIGGGSQVASPESHEPPAIVDVVARRVALSDGWLTRPSAEPEQIELDWQKICSSIAEAGRKPSDVTFCYKNYVHLVDAKNHATAVARQVPIFQAVMGTGRSVAYMERGYILGTTEEVVQKIQRVVESGATYVVLNDVTDDPAQLDRWARDILPHFSSGHPTSRSALPD